MLYQFKSLDQAINCWCQAHPGLRSQFGSIPELAQAWHTKAMPMRTKDVSQDLMEGITRRTGTRPAWIFRDANGNTEAFEDRDFARGGKVSKEQALADALREAMAFRDGSPPPEDAFQEALQSVLEYVSAPERRRIDPELDKRRKEEREQQKLPPSEYFEDNPLTGGPYGEYGEEDTDPYEGRSNLPDLPVSQTPLPEQREPRVGEMARRAERGEQVITAEDRLTRPEESSETDISHQAQEPAPPRLRGRSTRGSQSTTSRSRPIREGREDKAYVPSQPMPPSLPPKSLFGPPGRKHLAQHGPDDRLSRRKSMRNVPFGVQVLKRLWDDNAALLHEYDEFGENSDSQAVKFLCSSLCVQHRKNLDEITRVWHAHPMSKAFELPEGMDSVPPPDEYEVEETDRRHQRALGAGEFGSDEYFDALVNGEDDEDEEQMGGQDFMRGLGSQMGPDQKIPMGQEQFHKALVNAADFMKSLVKMGETMSNEAVGAVNIGWGENDQDQELQSPLARRQKKSFTKNDQSAARRQATELEQATPDLNNLDVQSEIQEAIRLLRGLADSREGSGSEEGLSSGEIDSLERKEKALRSIINSSRKGKFPKAAVRKMGQKGIELSNVMNKEMGLGHAKLAEIAQSQAQQTREIENLNETLQKLSTMLS